jgi:hypothetical protein
MAYPSTYTSDTVNQLAAALNAQRATSGAKWEGGLGVDKSALYMADELAKSGITDLSQVGQGNGNIINKVTGQPLYSGYGERTGGNIWSGSYEGGGNTGFGVNFDDKGNPIFFTQGASSSTLKDDLIKAAALAAAAYGGYTLMGGAGAGGLTVSELAAADMALGGVGGTVGAEALSAAALSGATGAGASALANLTPTQIANLAKAGISVAGLMGAGNAVSNMGGGTTPTGVSIPTQAAPQYNADYYSRVQGAYNQALPGMPRDVVSNLAAWYGGDSGMMSGTDTANTAIANQIVKPVVPPKIPAKLVDPMTNLMNAYRSGNTADTKKALIGALNAGMTTEQLMSTFDIDMKGIDYLRGQGYYLPAMTSEIQGVVANEMKNPVTAYQNIVARMDATGTNPAAVAAAMNIPVEEIQNAYNQLNPTGLFANNNPNYGAVDAGLIYNLAANPADYQTAIEEVQKYRAADEVGQQSVVERALAAELAARPGSSLSALQQAGSTYGVSAADVAAAYAKLGYV